MNNHLIVAIAGAGGFVAFVNLLIALLGPALNREGARLAADKLALDRENEVREEADKMRAELRAENTELRQRAAAAELKLSRMQSRCIRSCGEDHAN